MKTLNWMITHQCHLGCRHCCYDCKPNGHTTSLEDAKLIVDHFPSQVDLLGLTGGEIFDVKSLFYDILSYIHSKKTRPKSIALMTSGYWASDEDEVYRILKELHEFGVNQIEFTSSDSYHENMHIDLGYDSILKSGIVARAHKRLRDDLKIIKLPFDLRTRGADGYVLPFGRAKHFPKEELAISSLCYMKDFLAKGQEFVTINPFGEVYPCCMQMPYSMGNAIESPLEEIFCKAMQDPVLMELNKGGLQGVAKKHGVDFDSDNPCCHCEEVFDKLKEKIKAGGLI